MDGSRRMNTWRMNGSQERAVSPSMPFTVGTVRQPMTCCPSDCTTCSNFCSMARRNVGLRGRKMMPLPYWPAGGQHDAGLAADLLVEGVWHLDEHARAVAGVDLAAAGAPVVEVLQYLDRLLEDAVRLVPLDVDDEADAARVVLEAGVVQSLLAGTGGRGARRVLLIGGPACRSRMRRPEAQRCPGSRESDPRAPVRQDRGNDLHMTCGLARVNAVQQIEPGQAAVNGRTRIAGP